MTIDDVWLRVAVLASLVKRAPEKPGRTALMKFAYFLQTVRDVPLGYRFRLYNYGPYDSTVIGDLSFAATHKAVKTRLVSYPNSYGYEYDTNTGYDSIRSLVAGELDQYDADIDWVLTKFGDESASTLELYSTIVFADREMTRKHQEPTIAELCRRVKGIKPHFSEDAIRAAVEYLSEEGLAASTA